MALSWQRGVCEFGTASGPPAPHWSARENIVLELRHERCIGVGEAAPLPGFSSETLNDVEAELSRLDHAELARLCASSSDAYARRALEDCSLETAGGRFALQTALLDLWAQQRGWPMWRMLLALYPQYDARTPSEPEARVLATCEVAQWTAVLGDAETVKVKLSADWRAQLPQLRALRAERPALAIRLDANQALAPTELADCLASLAPLRPEFIEEPCPLSSLGQPRKLPIPLAFDESLPAAARNDAQRQLLEAWLHSGAVNALVLKPMLLGAVTEIVLWLQVAARHGIEVVFSHALDGAVALRAYQHFAYAFGSRRFAMGLGTSRGLGLFAHTAQLPSTLSSSGLGLRVSEAKGPV